MSVPALNARQPLGWQAALRRPRLLGAWAIHHRWMTGAVLAVAAIVAIGVVWKFNTASPIQYATAPVTRGDVVTTITASGTVNPVTTIEVGTYVSGTIDSLSCDYNTKVLKGQLCAKIDPKPYQVVVDQDQADLDVAKAQVIKDRANRTLSVEDDIDRKSPVTIISTISVGVRMACPVITKPAARKSTCTIL